MSLAARVWWWAISEVMRHAPPSLRKASNAPKGTRVRCVNRRFDPDCNWYESVDEFLYNCEFRTGGTPELFQAPDGWYTFSLLGDPELTLIPESREEGPAARS